MPGDCLRATLEVIRRALEAAGVEFIDENCGGTGVRLRKRLSERPLGPASVKDNVRLIGLSSNQACYRITSVRLLAEDSGPDERTIPHQSSA